MLSPCDNEREKIILVIQLEILINVLMFPNSILHLALLLSSSSPLHSNSDITTFIPFAPIARASVRNMTGFLC